MCYMLGREKENMAASPDSLREGHVLVMIPAEGLISCAARKLILRIRTQRAVQMTVTTSRVLSEPSDDDDDYVHGGGLASAAGAAGLPSGVVSTNGSDFSSAAGAAELPSGVVSVSGDEQPRGHVEYSGPTGGLQQSWLR